jgi:Animal haem peroxidase
MKAHEPTTYRSGVFWRLFDSLSEAIDRRVGWHRLPRPVGLLVLVGLRNVLRRRNLYDTAQGSSATTQCPPFEPAFLVTRTPEGTYNDLEAPTMGSHRTRFGRNIPIAKTQPELEPMLLEPNPRTVSRELLTRTEFIPATSLNLLAATWIQFMVKDWFSHGEGDPSRVWELPVDSDDPWYERPMKVLKTLKDPTTAPQSQDPPTFLNTETHWWDGSQIYGTTPEGQVRRRTGSDGKLSIGGDGRLQLPDDPALNPARVPGWWLGLNMMATLFILEHNTVCDTLKASYPNWTDEELFQRARLVVSALIAKIHTVDWTPAIIAHPTTVTALRANWWGLAGDRVRKAFGRISASEVISGITGSETDHYGVPYSLTEEFAVVYRMHPLIPDLFSLRAAANDSAIRDATFREIAGVHAQEVTADVSHADLLYSFGTSHPGALVLDNFPCFLQEFQRPDHEDAFMDLAAIDILRARELGVPRYNEFRRLLRLAPARTFEELAGDPDLAERVRSVYSDDIERVDLMVGMFAERRPKGFGFSDTAFRIFILMASRRLNSDRFFTNDFNPKVYTPVGFDWVEENDMTTVLLRHHPELRAALRGVGNPFAPWGRATA